MRTPTAETSVLRATELSYVHRNRPRRDSARPATARLARPDARVEGVHRISLELSRGAIAGLIGPNGSGKTTLLRLLAGVLRPMHGRVFLNDRDLSTLPRAHVATRIAVVPQETHLTFDYTVLEVALMGRYPHLGAFELEGPDDVSIAQDALRQTGTAELASRSFATLSGGEKQRAIIAGALAQAADILLLDEPTASLDLAYQIEIGELLRTLNRERGLTMLVATHDLNFAASLCTHMFLLRQGALLAAGPTPDVLNEDTIRQLYGVEADVRMHPAAGHMTVVPVGRSEERGMRSEV